MDLDHLLPASRRVPGTRGPPGTAHAGRPCTCARTASGDRCGSSVPRRILAPSVGRGGAPGDFVRPAGEPWGGEAGSCVAAAGAVSCGQRVLWQRQCSWAGPADGRLGVLWGCVPPRGSTAARRSWFPARGLSWPGRLAGRALSGRVLRANSLRCGVAAFRRTRDARGWAGAGAGGPACAGPPTAALRGCGGPVQAARRVAACAGGYARDAAARQRLVISPWADSACAGVALSPDRLCQQQHRELVTVPPWVPRLIRVFPPIRMDGTPVRGTRGTDQTHCAPVAAGGRGSVGA
ncbi:hypothetical protein SAMN02787118_1405 [Streptomyces mirabilis]|uniref:Uncharacterized protein n=1 Tax=Streptomyces mirabilis TaxID=68239 RepID=A0A1I2WTH3_9ACTN|nr:hypothetical protein SAMN02787118_1405 [Streptomyces mirabilis]